MLARNNMQGPRPVGRPRRLIASDRIAGLRELGMSFREIARVMGAGYGTVRRAYARRERAAAGH